MFQAVEEKSGWEDTVEIVWKIEYGSHYGIANASARPISEGKQPPAATGSHQFGRWGMGEIRLESLTLPDMIPCTNIPNDEKKRDR